MRLPHVVVKECVCVAIQIQETNKLVTTILDVQPRLGGGSGGKSNDDIVYELSESILEKVIEKLDIDEAKAEMFDLDDKGRMKSLTTVLVQEVDRFNKLLKVVKVSRWPTGHVRHSCDVTILTLNG